MHIHGAVMTPQAGSLNFHMNNASSLANSLKSKHSWVSSYQAVLLEINNANPSDDPALEFAQFSRQTYGPVPGDIPRPTGK